jgi:hypothetical protein
MKSVSVTLTLPSTNRCVSQRRPRWGLLVPAIAAAMLFAAVLQAQQAPTIVKPTAVPNHIPVGVATNVFIRAKLVLQPGNEVFNQLYVVEKLAAGEALLGTIGPDAAAGPNVFGGRVAVSASATGTLNLVVATAPPGTAGITSSGITITVFGSNTVSHVIDPTIYNGPPELPEEGFGARPVVAVKDSDGITSQFIANQVIFSGTSAQMDAFVTQYGGAVVSQISTANMPNIPPTALVVLDASTFSEDNLDANTGELGGRGQMTFSSDLAARLAALVATEVVAGQRVALNFVSETQDFLWSTTEEADQNGVSNAFNWPEFDKRAWEFVVANGFKRRVNLAVIDGGFWLNSSGEPFTDSAGRSDLPKHPIQWNPITGTANAGGPNLNTCTGGASCPWHGNGTASIAAGTLNNDAGAAGTGGLVANPMLMLFDGSDYTVEADITQAMNWGVDIISMSFEGHCGFWCGAGHTFGWMDGIMNNALDSGVLMVAAAGNDASDAESVNSWPCTYSSDNNVPVFCVGALGSNNDSFGYFQSYTGGIASYSNYGLGVNIWAPTNLHAMPNATSGGALVSFNGTSASTPYVAGVAAMIKAINPGLNNEQIENIIGNGPYTPGTSSWDDGYFPPYGPWAGNVGFVIQPYPAVVSAAGGYRLHPDSHITAPKNNAKFDPYTTPVKFTAIARDVNDGNLDSSVVWTSDVDGDLGVGSPISYDFSYGKEGVRHVTAKVTNSFGFSSTETITITIIFPHTPPKPVIIWPTNGLTINPGTYTVTGYSQSTNPGIDLENIPCNQLFWDGSVTSKNLPESLGMCQAQLTLSAGKQKITLSASNRLGDKGTTTVTVNVAASPNLTVYISDPPNNAIEYLNEGSNQALTFSGHADGAFIKGATARWNWSWYYAGASPTTAQPIGSSTTSSQISWIPQSSGFCGGGGGGGYVAVLLQVNDATSTVPFRSVSGSGTTEIQIQCTAPPK